MENNNDSRQNPPNSDLVTFSDHQKHLQCFSFILFLYLVATGLLNPHYKTSMSCYWKSFDCFRAFIEDSKMNILQI